MNRYTISIDLNSSIEAKSEEEALIEANKRIKEKAYSIIIVDREEVK